MSRSKHGEVKRISHIGLLVIGLLVLTDSALAQSTNPVAANSNGGAAKTESPDLVIGGQLYEKVRNLKVEGGVLTMDYEWGMAGVLVESLTEADRKILSSGLFGVHFVQKTHKGNESATKSSKTVFLSNNIDELKQFAKDGNGRAAAILSYRHRIGWGVAVDAPLQFTYAQTAATVKDSLGLYCLSLCYRYGAGVSEDKTLANELESKALLMLESEKKSGDPWVMFALGRIYDTGETVPKNEAKAVEFYRKSADLGNAAAMYNLGGRYEQGKGVTKDETKAVEYLIKAGAQGFDDGYLLAGLLYAGNKNYANAVKYWDKVSLPTFEKHIKQYKNPEKIRESLGVIYGMTGRVPPWLRAAVDKMNIVDDPDSKTYGGPSTKEVMAVLGGNEMMGLFFDGLAGKPKKNLRRGKPLKSTGGRRIPSGVTLYPIRYTITPSGGLGAALVNSMDFYFFKDEFGDWTAIEKPK